MIQSLFLLALGLYRANITLSSVVVLVWVVFANLQTSDDCFMMKSFESRCHEQRVMSTIVQNDYVVLF